MAKITKPKTEKPSKIRNGSQVFATEKLDKYMTIDELAKALKMSKSHIYYLTSKKLIPHVKLFEKKLLFEKTAIKNWLNSKKVSAN